MKINKVFGLYGYVTWLVKNGNVFKSMDIVLFRLTDFNIPEAVPVSFFESLETCYQNAFKSFRRLIYT